MIVFFSATGNCEFTAKTIATKTNDTAVSMTEINDKITLKSGESLGIVTPTYFWGLPSYVDNFLKNIEIENAENSYIYCIASYGTTSGQTDYFINKHLKSKGLKLSASYSIKTVDNWTVLFSVNDENEVKQSLKNEALQIEQIIELINKQSNVFINKDKKSLFMCTMAGLFYEGARKTKHLHAEDSCISCGMCEDGCPVNAIKIVDGKPNWITKKCVMCLKCLHNCPKFAIQYDNKTQSNGQYTHPEFQTFTGD